MHNKGGKVFGSIYRRKDKNGLGSYTAEIQFQGQRIRRTDKDKSVLEEWMQVVCSQLNVLLEDYNAVVELRMNTVKKEAFAQLMERAKPILDDARQYDLVHRIAAEKAGLTRVDHFRTYLLYDECTGAVKIGKTHDLFTRMNVMCLRSIQLLAYSEQDCEVQLHKEYKHKRIKGEWFALNGEDIDAIFDKYFFSTPGVLFRSGGRHL